MQFPTLNARHTMRQIAYDTLQRQIAPLLVCTAAATRLLALLLSLRYVLRIQTSLDSCDTSQRQNSVAVAMIFTCDTRRFVAATCRGARDASFPFGNKRCHFRDTSKKFLTIKEFFCTKFKKIENLFINTQYRTRNL